MKSAGFAFKDPLILWDCNGNQENQKKSWFFGFLGFLGFLVFLGFLEVFKRCQKEFKSRIGFKAVQKIKKNPENQKTKIKNHFFGFLGCHYNPIKSMDL